MNPLGVHLTLKIGRSTPRIAPPELVEALESVEVTQTDHGPSGFQMTFQIGRSSAVDVVDYRLLLGLEGRRGLLKPFNRVVLIVGFSVRPQILMDGIITNLQLSPNEDPGQSRLVVTGEDISLLMDLEQKRETYPDITNAGQIVREILGRYREYFTLTENGNGLSDIQDEERHDVRQIESDRKFLDAMAQKLGFVFYVTPGDAPSQNLAYFGPRRRDRESQPALSYNMGPHSNVDSISFTYDGDKAITVADSVQTERDGEIVDEGFMVLAHEVQPAMARQDSMYSDLAHRRQLLLDKKVSSLDEAMNKAQATVNRSAEAVVTAKGELDGLRYGRLLQPHKKVGVRGVGRSFDGDYYVSSVNHSIQRGSYKQRFSLSREGVGALRPMVRP